MPLDHRIIGSGQPVQFRSLLDIVPKAQGIGANIRAAESERMKLTQEREAMDDSKVVRQSLKDATSLDPATGKPALNLHTLAGRLAQSGNVAAVPIASALYKEDNDLKAKNLERSSKFATTELARRRLLKSIADTMSTDETSFMIGQSQIRDLGLEDIAPMEITDGQYDKGLVEKWQQGLLSFEQRQSAAVSAQNANTAAASLAAIEENRDAERNSRMKGQDASFVKSLNERWDSGSGTILRKAAQAKAKVDAFSGNFNADGTVKADTDETAVDAGLADGLGLYGFANERDPLGAVMTSDVEVTLSGRGLLTAAETGFMKALGHGKLSPEERVAIKALSDILYEKQVAAAEENRMQLKKEAAEYAAAGGSFLTPQQMADMTASTEYLPGQPRTRYIAPQRTEGSTARSRPPAGAVPPTAGSSAAPAQGSPPGTPGTSPQAGGRAPVTLPPLNLPPRLAGINANKRRAESGGRQFDENGATIIGPENWTGERAVGISQIMPSTAKEVAAELGLPYNEQWLHTDAAYNQYLGDYYMAKMVKMRPETDEGMAQALASYNAGPARIDAAIAKAKEDKTNWFAEAPPETQDYVSKIIAAQIIDENPGQYQRNPETGKKMQVYIYNKLMNGG